MQCCPPASWRWHGASGEWAGPRVLSVSEIKGPPLSGAAVASGCRRIAGKRQALRAGRRYQAVAARPSGCLAAAGKGDSPARNWSALASQLKPRPAARHASRWHNKPLAMASSSRSAMAPAPGVTAHPAGQAPDRPPPACRKPAPRSSPARRYRCGWERRTHPPRHSRRQVLPRCGGRGNALAESAPSAGQAPGHRRQPLWYQGAHCRGTPRYSFPPPPARHRAGSAGAARGTGLAGHDQGRKWPDPRPGSSGAAVSAPAAAIARECWQSIP